MKNTQTLDTRLGISSNDMHNGELLNSIMVTHEDGKEYINGLTGSLSGVRAYGGGDKKWTFTKLKKRTFNQVSRFAEKTVIFSTKTGNVLAEVERPDSLKDNDRYNTTFLALTVAAQDLGLAFKNPANVDNIQAAISYLTKNSHGWVAYEYGSEFSNAWF